MPKIATTNFSASSHNMTLYEFGLVSVYAQHSTTTHFAHQFQQLFPGLRNKMALGNEHTNIILQRIFEDGVFSDRITLISGEDKQRVAIHRAVFIASSKYFAAALKPNFKEPPSSEFTIDNTDYSTLKAVVDFCYLGLIDLTEANVSDYLAIASCRELDLLERKCWLFLAEKLSVDNADQIWLLADGYSNRDICQRALQTVLESVEKISFQGIESFDHRLLEEILKSNLLHTTEELVFRRLMDWFRCNEKDHEQHMKVLLKLIRLEIIPPQCLNDKKFTEIYKKFGCYELLLAERKKRKTKGGEWVAGIRRRRSIYCLFTQMKREDSAEHSAIKIERYDSASNELEQIGEIALGDRVGFGVTLHKNKVYVFGGKVNGVYQKRASMFDLATGDEEVLPEMNFARGLFPSLIFDDCIYVFGGVKGRARLNSCERFDMKSKTWKTLKPMKFARSYASSVVYNGYIYVAGGYCNGNIKRATVELYDAKVDGWLQVASMGDIRCAFALFTSNHFVYAIGCVSEVERYNIPKNIWTKMGYIWGKDWVTSSVETDDGVFLVKINGEFGRIDVNGSGSCSLQLLGKSKYSSKFLGNHHLFNGNVIYLPNNE